MYLETILELARNPYPDGSARCRQVRTAHRVEVVAVGQVAAHQFGSQVLADFVAQVGIPYRNYLDPMSRSYLPAPGRTIRIGITGKF